MGLSLNKIVKPQTIALNKKSKVLFNECSSSKRLYVEGEKLNLKKKDIYYLLKNIKSIYKLPSTLLKTVNLIKRDKNLETKKISKKDFQKLTQLIESLGVDDYGFFKITPDKLFKDCGVPHRYALVLSVPMSNEAFQTAPSITCQHEVARIYVKSGEAANRVALLLQKMGYGASPNHSMGGQLDYSMAAEWAGIGVVGRHSMSITPKNGPCHRVSIVYTDIENLNEFIQRDYSDLEWIKSFCKKCGKCIRKCPTGAILTEPVILDGYNPTKVEYDKCCKGFLNYGCGLCIKECPFTSGDYLKMKDAFYKSNQRNKERD